MHFEAEVFQNKQKIQKAGNPDPKNNEKLQKLSFLKCLKSIENIIASFSASNNIDFWSQTIHMLEK